MNKARLDEEAAAWFLAQQANALTPPQRQAFDDWLAGSPDAPEAYRYAERAWRLVGGEDEEAPLSNDGAFGWRSSRRLGWTAGALAASIAVMLAATIEPVSRFVDAQLAPTRGGGQLLVTDASQRLVRRLSDGTIVTLDGDTRLQVLEMGAQRRIALLAGHAFFKVAKDPAHPFLVTAMNKTVHAIGTAFDVKVEPDAVAVTLVEGKVRVDQSRGLLRDPIATDMTPGKRLVASNDQVWLMSPIDPVVATSWLKGRLTYTGEAVSRIVADVNVGSNRQIVFVRPLDDRIRIVGGFKQGDVDTLSAILEVKGIAHVVERTDTVISMAPEDAPSASE